MDCHKIINNAKADIFCAMETKISSDLFSDFMFNKKIQLFASEGSSNNFGGALGGCILLKWIVAFISFSTMKMSDQFIHGLLTYGSSSFFLVFMLLMKLMITLFSGIHCGILLVLLIGLGLSCETLMLFCLAKIKLGASLSILVAWLILGTVFLTMV